MMKDSIFNFVLFVRQRWISMTILLSLLLIISLVFVATGDAVQQHPRGHEEVMECGPGEEPDAWITPLYLPNGFDKFEPMLASQWQRSLRWKHLKCEELVFHSQDLNSVEYTKMIREVNINYFRQYHPTYCYLNAYYSCRPSERDQRVRDRRQESRYACTLRLMKLVEDGYIETNNAWVNYIDADVVIGNRTATFADVRNRVALGLAANETAESRVFKSILPKHPVHLGERPGDKQTSTSLIDSVALISGADVNCHTFWHVNSGVLFLQRSRVAKFIQHAVVGTLDYSNKEQDKFAGVDVSWSDQGKLETVFYFLFGVDLLRLQYLCSNKDLLTESCQGVLPFAIGRFNLTRAFEIPEYKDAAIKVFGSPEGSPKGSPPQLQDNEPDLVVLMCPRWLNSPACGPKLKWRLETELSFKMDCGDFLQHFNGCSKDSFHEDFYRNEVGKCAEVWPGTELPTK